jgi:pyruvate,water dikinase
VQVRRHPFDGEHWEGAILVAERTDPGWTPIFPAFAGLIIERGSPLSHSAIVARELGIPAIVGVTGAAARLRTGQHVTMDGGQATIHVHNGEPGATTSMSQQGK